MRGLGVGIAAAAMLLLVLVGGASWLLYTTAGARWLLLELPAEPVTGVSAARLEGSLLGELRLADYRLQRNSQGLAIGQLSMRSRLTSLLPLRLRIEQLQLTDISLQLPEGDQEPKPLRLVWPELPAAADWLEVTIDALQIERLRWQQGTAPAQSLTQLSTALDYRAGQLRAENLHLQLNETLSAEGQLSLGVRNPQLLLEASLQNRAAGAGWKGLTLETELRGNDAWLLQGETALQLQTQESGSIRLSAELRLSETRLEFDRLKLSRAGREGSLAAQGAYQFFRDQPQLRTQLQLHQLDLEQEAGQPLRLSGTLQFSGHPQQYSGRLSLKSSGSTLTTAELSSDFNGDLQQLQLKGIQGRWLQAALSGRLAASWAQGWQLQSDLEAEGLNPQLLEENLSGSLNLNLIARLHGSDSQAPAGQLQLQLHDSLLHGQPLTGQLRLQLAENQLQIETLNLQGTGIGARAAGRLDERLDLQLQVARLDQLQPQLKGSVTASGWLRWQAQQLDVDLRGVGKGLGYQQWQIERATLALRGNLDQHQLSLQLEQPPGQAELTLAGGWRKDRWQGQLTQLRAEGRQLGDWQLVTAVPLELSAEQIAVAPLQLRSEQASLTGSGNFRPGEQRGQAQLRWNQLPLGLLQSWLPNAQLAGHSDGSLNVLLDEAASSRLEANLELQGSLKQEKLQLEILPSRLTASWDAAGLQSQLNLALGSGGQLQAELQSPEPFGLTPPQQGTFHLTGQQFPLTSFHPWLPPTLNLAGQLNLQSSGRWFSGRQFSLRGEAVAEQGKLSWLEEEGTVDADFSTARLDWQWQEDLLSGKLALELSEQGEVDGDFRLPLTSRLPVQTLPEPLQAELSAKLQELGLLALIFPGAVQESRGQLNLGLNLAGDWQQPELTGRVHLFDAGAFLPAAGIQLQGVELRGRFDERRFDIEQLQLNSGDGQLTGTGQLQLSRWQPGTYQLRLQGKNFQLLNLAELQLRLDPDLQIDGDREQLRVRGKLLIPELLISGKQKSSLPANSPDLVILDAEEPPQRRFRLRHDIDLQLQLGERVLLKTSGIDAKLAGALRLQTTAQQELAATGDIRVEKGRYVSYGVNLAIERGYLYFTGGPLDQPNLDILALRKAGEVKAGVRVSGTPQQPQVQLYSQPGMPESEILSYIVLGRPLGADSDQTGLLLSAAGALLSQGESVMVQEKLKQQLGLDVLDISAGDGDVTSSVITTGKYLSPDLYISLGYSLFTNSNEFRVRYNLTPAWELESNIGIESGIDMYYRIEIE